MGYVMVSRALLQEICEKKGAACCEEEAFLRVLTNVNFKPAVVFCNGGRSPRTDGAEQRLR